MITVVTRWEHTQLPPVHEWQLWGAMRGAFGITRFKFVPVMAEMKNIDIDQYDTMEEALASLPEDLERVFLEPTGYNSLSGMPKGDIALILGNTARDNLTHAKVNETYCIYTEGATRHNHLYAPNAAAIALAMRYGQ
jgi:hypothetical protein